METLQAKEPLFSSPFTDFNCDETRGRDAVYYLNLVKDFKSSYPPPVLKVMYNGLTVVDESVLDSGSKGRFAEPLIASLKEKIVVYAQAKFGYAAISLLHLCKMHNKKLVLFMPAAKTLSPYQLYCISNGAIPIFLRVAAFPPLISAARKWSVANKAAMLPLGLHNELITAMIVRTCREISAINQIPNHIWCAVSTGVLARGIQIAWPTAKVTGVLVARNLHPGEAGNMEAISYAKPIYSRATSAPGGPDACPELDGKALEYMLRYGKPGDWFWNVAGACPRIVNAVQINSEREWGDQSDLTKVI